jgi:tetratricopeptide (TPR) repeat protein
VWLALALLLPAGWHPAAGADAAALSRGGRAAMEDGQFELASRLYAEWLAAAPGAVEARLGLARAAYGLKDPARMLAALPVAGAPPKGQPLAADYRYHRALALDELGSRDEALAELDDPDVAAEPGPLALDARRLRAWILLRQARWPEADRAFAAWEAMGGAAGVNGPAVLEWADALLAAGRPQGAEAVLKRLLERRPAPELEWLARLRLARALAGQNLGRAADLEADRLVAPEAPPRVRMEAWLLRAELAEARTNGAEACQAASNAVALAQGPSDLRRTQTLLGRLLLKHGAVREGAERLQAIIAADPGDPQSPGLQLVLAKAFMDSGRAAEAEANYRYYLESFTNAAGVIEALEGRSWALIGLARFAEAAAGFEKAAGLAAEPARRDRLLYKAGDAYFADRHYQLAAERYKAVMEAKSDPVLAREARFQSAETMARLGREPEALAELAAIEKDGAGGLGERAALRIAELHQDAGALTEARQAYDRFLRVYTNSAKTATVLYNRGLVGYQTYLFETALADFEAVLARFPESPLVENADYMKVCTAFQLYNDGRAERLAQAFLKARPASTWAPQVRFREAEFAFNRGAYDAAETNFLSVTEGWPQDPLAGDALFWAARAASARKQFKRAIEIDTRLVKEWPEHPKVAEAQFYQAEELGKLGDYPGAIALLDEVIKRQPDSFLAFAAKAQRGECQFTLGADDPARYEEAIRSYQELASNAKAPFELRLQAAYRIGRALQKLGRTDEAFEQYYTKVILVFLEARQAGEPMNESGTAWFTSAAFDAAAILEGRGRWRQAVRLYQRVVDAGVTAADDARRRIEAIQREHWRFF